MKSVRFSLRFAFQNIRHNAGKSIVLLFSSIIAAMLLFLLFNTYPVLVQVVENEAIDRYQDIDLVMTFDANSDTRLLNQRRINEVYATAFREYATFFNFTGLISSPNEEIQAQIYGGPENGLRFVSKLANSTLQADEIVMTVSLANRLLVGIDSIVELSIHGTQVAYRVAMLAEDGGLLDGSAVFLDKNALLERVYNIAGLNNLGNTIYFKLVEPTTAASWIDRFATDAEYQNFPVYRVIDEPTIRQIARYSTSILVGVSLFGLIAVALIIHSLVPLFYKEFRIQYGVVKSLGGPPVFLQTVWFLVFLLNALIAIPLGIWITQLVFRQGALLYGVTNGVHLDLWWTLGAAGVFGFLFLTNAMLELKHFERLSGVAAATDKRMEKASPHPLLLVILLGLLVLNLTIPMLPEGPRALVTVLLGIGVTLELITASFAILKRWSKQWRPSYFRLVSVPMLEAAKPIHSALRVAYLSILIIISSLSIGTFVTTETDRIEQEVLAEYFLTNLFDYDSAIQDDVASFADIESVDEAILFQKVSLSTQGQSKVLRFFISMEADRLGASFAFPIIGDYQTKFNNPDRLYAVIPISIAKSYRLAIGDTVEIRLNQALGTLSFEIAGLIDTNYDNIIFTNLIRHTASRTIQSVNTLFINATPSSALQTELIRQYSANMYVLMNMAEVVDQVSAPIRNVIDFVVLIALVIIVAFSVVIWNNSQVVFLQFQSDYAKYAILGCSKKELLGRIAIEYALLSFLLVIAAIANILVVLPHVSDMMLVLGYYKDVPYPFVSSMLFALIGIAMFWLSYLSFAWKMHQLHPLTEIKKY
jgi:hypothetical protein